MRQQDMFKTTGKRRGLWERLADGLRGARTAYLVSPAHRHDATNAPQSIPTPQPTTEMAQRAFSRLASHGQAPAESEANGPSNAVAYLDIGAGGYLDLGTDLTDEALLCLPKGRHALVIAGTYGIDGYTAAPAPAQPVVPHMSASEVNALPAAAREYIHQLVTNADPAGMPRENMQLRDTNAGLQAMYRKAADSVLEDAARYRWLREGNDAKHGAAWHVAVNLYGCEWDAAIDAAMNKGGAT